MRPYRTARTSPDGWHLFRAPPDAHMPRPATGALREAIIRTCDRLTSIRPSCTATYAGAALVLLVRLPEGDAHIAVLDALAQRATMA